MAFDDIIRPQAPNPPVVTRIAPKPEPAPPPRPVQAEEERAAADAEPHFPRIFPGI